MGTPLPPPVLAERNPITPDPAWMDRIPVLRDMVGAAMSASLVLLVAGVLLGALAWALAYAFGATQTRAGRGILAAVTGACVLACLPALVGFIDTGPWT